MLVVQRVGHTLVLDFVLLVVTDFIWPMEGSDALWVIAGLH